MGLAGGLRWAALAAVLVASAAVAIDFRSDEEAVLSGARDDMAFAAGRRVEVSVDSTDDVYAAGATVRVAGARADRITAAGETILLSGFQSRGAAAVGLARALAQGPRAAEA